jgi:hypothetical protein
MIHTASLKIVHVESFLDRAFAGCNPENADASNPDGAYYETVNAVVAETADGRRFVLAATLASKEHAERTVARIRAEGAITPSRWTETFPAYGSAAWAAEEGTRRLDLRAALERGDREAVDRLA